MSESWPGRPSLRQIRVSPSDSAWSVTALKSRGRRSRTVRSALPSRSWGWIPTAPPFAKRYASSGRRRVPCVLASSE
jgi:hypothetical protein